MLARLLVPLAALLLGVSVLAGPLGSPATAQQPNLASQIDLPPAVKQLVTVTNRRWSDTKATMRVWQRRGDSWRLVRGPVVVSLGWNGFAKAAERRQSTGTTPAGRFTMPRVFGNRPDPGSRLPYRRVDGDDVWPYEPRDPATYNILQPRRAAGSRWRSGYVERLADYPVEYAYSIVLGYNLPKGVRWSPRRKQFVARNQADTARGGGIFLHVKENRYTAGCVSGPIDDVRWLVRWLDPDARPRIVMGPRAWVVRRF